MRARIHDMLRRLIIFQFEFIYGEIVEESEVEVEDIRRDILVFESKHLPGATLFSGEIMLNQKLLEDSRQKGLRNVFLHEEAHRRQNILSHLTGIAQIVLSPLGLVLGVFTAVLLATELVNNFLILNAVLTVYILSAIVSYIGELQAQFFVLDHIGTENFKAGKSELSNVLPLNPLRKILIYPSHPPDWLTLKLYQLIAK